MGSGDAYPHQVQNNVFILTFFAEEYESVRSFSPPRSSFSSLHFLMHSFNVLAHSQEDIQGSMVMYLYQKKEICVNETEYDFFFLS